MIELRISLDSKDKLTTHSDILGTVTDALNASYPTLILCDVKIFEDKGDDNLAQRISQLSGRSKIIASFLFNNPGPHSTLEIRNVIDQELPFKKSSILHSYLNNLISRGLVTKVSAGYYKTTRGE